MNVTDHALLRMQQRGVSCDALEALMAFGRIRRKSGVRVVYYDHGAQQAVSRERSGRRMSAQMGDKLRGLYAVIGTTRKLSLCHTVPRVFDSTKRSQQLEQIWKIKSKKH